VDYDLVLCLWAILHCFRLQAAYDEMGWSKGAVTQELFVELHFTDEELSCLRLCTWIVSISILLP